MSKKLYPIINLPSTGSGVIHLRTSDMVQFLPLTRTFSVYIKLGVNILIRKFSRPLMKTKILNWRLPDQTVTVGFDFVDGTGFDFMDGDSFDFMDA